MISNQTPSTAEAEALQVTPASDTKSAQEHVEAATDFFNRRATAHKSLAEMRQRTGAQP